MKEYGMGVACSMYEEIKMTYHVLFEMPEVIFYVF